MDNRKKLAVQESVEREEADLKNVESISPHKETLKRLAMPKIQKIVINPNDAVFQFNVIMDVLKAKESSSNPQVMKLTNFDTVEGLEQIIANPEKPQRIEEMGGSFVFSGQLAVEIKKKWKTRVWSLSDNGLGYLKKKRFGFLPGKYKNVLKLKDICDVYHDESCFLIDECCFAVQLPSNKKYYLKADNRREMLAWMIVIFQLIK